VFIMVSPRTLFAKASSSVCIAISHILYLNEPSSPKTSPDPAQTRSNYLPVPKWNGAVRFISKPTLHTPPVAFQDLLGDDLAWMEDIKQHHSQEHQRGIEHIKVCLCLQQRSILVLDVLGNSKHGPDHNKCACDV